MRTQIPGSQVRDESIDTDDINDLAVTEDKLGTTGVGAGTYSKVTVTTKGRVTAGTNPGTLADAGLTVYLDDLIDVQSVAPTLDDVLTWDGSKWINATPASIDSLLHLYSENPQSAVDAVASGFNSIALGSGSNAGASNSIAIGNQSLARVEGGIVHANGRFGSQGDAQKGTYLMRTHTVNANPTELFLNGTAGGDRLIIPDDCTWIFEATIVGHRQDGNDHAGYKVKGVIYKVGAINTAILGAVTKETIAANPAWDVAVTADSANGSLKITATGEAGKIVRWFATIETIEVTN